MSRRSAVLFVAASLATLLPAAWLAARSKRGGGGEGKAASTAESPLAADKGKFQILLNGQEVGTEEFQISLNGAQWVAHAKVDLSMPGAAPEQDTASLELGADGTPVHYEWSSQGKDKRSLVVDFQNGTAKMSLRKVGVQPFLQQFSFATPRIVVLDNNMYHQYDILAHLYDWKTKGTQGFPVLIPQDQLPGTITVESFGAQSVSGVILELLKVRSADLEVNLYLDSSHRLVRLEVPSSNAEVIRK